MCPLSATAYAPATIANLGPGFDIMGLALTSPGDKVTAELCSTPGVHIKAILGDDGLLPTSPTKNTACVAAAHVLSQVSSDHGLSLTLDKGLPLASGLGSSSASAVAGAVAANAVLGNPLSHANLLPSCVEAEAVVSGRHADNVAPALMGGIVLVAGLTADAIYPLPIPQGLHLAVVTPNVEVPTAQARAVLPDSVPLRTMVRQTAEVAQLVHALHTQDIPLLARAISGDQVVEKARSHLMPYLDEARAAAIDAGALAVVISGAGPTVVAICTSHKLAQDSALALANLYESKGLAVHAQATTVADTGARIVSTTG